MSKKDEGFTPTAERPVLIISLSNRTAEVIARYPHGQVVQAAGFFRECTSYWHPEEGKPDETPCVLFWPDHNLSAKQRAMGLCANLEHEKGEDAADARKAIMDVLRGFTFEEHDPRMDIEGIPVMQEGDNDYGVI